MSAVDVPQQDIDDLGEQAQQLLRAQGLPALLRTLAPGAYEVSHGQLEVLEAIERGVAALWATRAALAGRIEADRRAGLAGGCLTTCERRFCSLVAASVGAQEALAALDLRPEALPGADRHLKLSEYRELLTAPEETLAAGIVADLCGYLRFYGGHADERVRPADDARLAACAGGYLALVARTAQRLGDDGEYAAAREGLIAEGLRVGGAEYRGFERRRVVLPDQDSELLPVRPEDIVGNREVLDAAIALCRAIAGFDLQRNENPQTVRNQVIFVLGAPGCGKTVTAHAVGNYFLALCRANGIPARFRIIRRTDWASHYQNKSANELLRIFREEVFEFPGVAGVYWPDIDTAFAAREDPGIRAEEKALLGTLFGLLDGTVGPRNGKWFMIADANYLAMDEAVLSRLSQDPHRARGPQTAADFVALLRDKKLAHLAAHLPLTDEQWHGVGERFVAGALSGRAADNVAGQVVARIEDIELPDEYFALSFAEKRRLVEARRKSVDAETLLQLVARYVRFEKDAEEQARRERFERRVDEIRERLAAQVAAVGGGEDG